MSKLQMTCFLDLDGCIGDWESQAIKSLGGNAIDSVTKKELWQKITEYDATVEKFFENISKMNYADAMVAYLESVFDKVVILTASGHTPKDVAEQKIKWVKKHYSHLDVIVVRKSVDKAQYVDSNSILIDDREVSIDAWTNAGGVGILHTDFESTRNAVEHLRRYSIKGG